MNDAILHDSVLAAAAALTALLDELPESSISDEQIADVQAAMNAVRTAREALREADG